MVKVKGFVEDSLERIEQNVKSTAANQAKSTGHAIASQLGSQNQQTPSDGGTNEAGQVATQQASTDSTTQDMVKDLYAPSRPPNQQNSSNPPSKFVTDRIEEGMDPEKAVKLKQLRDKLQKEYFEKLTARKTADQEHKEEEGVKEEEKKMEELKLEDKKKKDDDVALRMSTHKTEQFPGSGG